MATIGCHDEVVLPTGPVRQIRVLLIEKDPILNGNGVQIAGVDPDEGQWGKRTRFDPFHLKAVAPSLCEAELQVRLVEKLLPGMGADDVAEQRLIAAP
jgi:hypothetical protein